MIFSISHQYLALIAVLEGAGLFLLINALIEVAISGSFLMGLFR
jgi:hypothetical protein